MQMQTKCFAIEHVKRCDYHREYGGILGMVPLRIDPIYTPDIVGIYLVYPLLNGSLAGLNS